MSVHDAPESLGDSPRFGRFVVLEKLGAGAMGVVYAAYDPTLDRRVALKVLRGAANRGGARERTRREALALARITHPNVVSLYEVGEADGRLFLAMEYVDGPTLDDWLSAEPRDWPAVVEVFRAILRGLAVAHEAGLVHRDMKPANVLVDRRGRPVIIDFGLALLAEDDGSADASDASAASSAAVDGLSRVTRAGRLRGTPAYMAPEVMAGGDHSPASDQFAVCTALFEALYGTSPFPRDDWRQHHHAKVNGQIAAPAADRVPPGLAAIVRRGLAPEPGDRFPDLAALAGALAAYDSETGDRELGRWGRRALALLAVGVMSGMAWLMWWTGARHDPAIFVQVSWIPLVAFVGGMLLLRWRFDVSLFNRGLYLVLFAALVAKQVGVMAGHALGMNVAQLLLLDGLVLGGIAGVNGLVVGIRATAWATVAAALPLAAIAWLPDAAWVLHDLALALIVFGFMLEDARRARSAGG